MSHRANTMICHNCGGKLEKLITSFPFKIDGGGIIVIKGLSVLQCRNCSEYVIEDEVMQNVDRLLNRIDKTAELEVLSYAV